MTVTNYCTNNIVDAPFLRRDQSAASQRVSANHGSLTETVPATTARPQDRLVPSNAVDRFQHLQSHVSSLRIIEAPQQTSHNEGRHVAHQKQRKPRVSSPVMKPIAPPIDLEEESKEMKDFLRQSRRLKQERHQMQAMRSSTTKESELALRLQHAQRQILQLKRHIQESESDDEGESVDAEDDLPTSSIPASPASLKAEEATDVLTRSRASRSSRRREGLNKGEALSKISVTELAKMQKEIQVRAQRSPQL